MGLKEWAATTEGRELGDPRPGEGAAVRAILGITYSPILISSSEPVGREVMVSVSALREPRMETWAH